MCYTWLLTVTDRGEMKLVLALKVFQHFSKQKKSKIIENVNVWRFMSV